MKLRIFKTLSVLTLGLGLAACSTVSLDDSATGTGSGASGMGGAAGSGVMDPFNPSSVLSKNRSVYFEFNSYTVFGTKDFTIKVNGINHQSRDFLAMSPFFAGFLFRLHFIYQDFTASKVPHYCPFYSRPCY